MVGGGFSGLTAALSLQDKGYSVYLFDDQPYLGGKAFSVADLDNPNNPLDVNDLGPVFISDTKQRPGPFTKYLNRFNIGREPYDQSTYTGFINKYPNMPPDAEPFVDNPLVNVTIIAAAKLYGALCDKYRRQLRNGFLNAVSPELFIPTLEFLVLYKLEVLVPQFKVVMTSEGYGDLAQVPALYTLRYVTKDKILQLLIPKIKLEVVKGGMAALVTQMSVSLFREDRIKLLHTLVSIERLPDSQSLVFFDIRKQQYSDAVTCRKTILAFPPLLPELRKIMWDMTDKEKRIIGQVFIHRFTSSALKLKSVKDNKHCCYIRALRLPLGVGAVPYIPGNGEIASILRQHTEVSWIFKDRHEGLSKNFKNKTSRHNFPTGRD